MQGLFPNSFYIFSRIFTFFYTILYFQQAGADPELCEQLLALCKQYDLDGSYRVTEIDPEGMRYLSQYDDVTEEMIQEDIVAYFRNKVL